MDGFGSTGQVTMAALDLCMLMAKCGTLLLRSRWWVMVVDGVHLNVVHSLRVLRELVIPSSLSKHALWMDGGWPLEEHAEDGLSS